MKRFLIITAALIVSMYGHAQISGTMSYQGYLTDDVGNPIHDETSDDHDITFKFYNTAGSLQFTRIVKEVKIQKGVFSVIIGNGENWNGDADSDNSSLLTEGANPVDWNLDYKITITVDTGTESSQIDLNSVPQAIHARSAAVADAVDGANITGNVNASLLSGTVANGRLDDDLQDLADGELSGDKIGTGINADNITSGTLSGGVLDAALSSIAGLTTAAGQILYTTGVDTYETTPITAFGASIIDTNNAADARSVISAQEDNTHLTDLSDGSLTGSKVGTGIDASNITTGTVANSLLDSDLQDLADGTLSDARLESTVDVTRLNTTGGVHVGGTVDPGVDNLIVDGTVSVGSGADPTTTFEVSHANGTPDSGEGLSLLNSSTRWTFSAQSGGELYLYYGNSALRGTFNNTTGAYASSSDRRIKKNISEINRILPDVKRIPIYKYHYKTQKNSEEKIIGTIAQDLLPIFPSLVQYSEENDFYTVDYSSLSAVAIKAIQEQQEIIEALQAELSEIKKELIKSVEYKDEMKVMMESQEEKIALLFKLIEEKSISKYKLLSSDVK